MMTKEYLRRFLRNLIEQGADIRSDYEGSLLRDYDACSRRLDALADERAERLWLQLEHDLADADAIAKYGSRL